MDNVDGAMRVFFLVTLSTVFVALMIVGEIYPALALVIDTAAGYEARRRRDGV